MELILLVVLMGIVSIIAYNAIRKKNDKPLLEKTMSINPNAVVKQPDDSTHQSTFKPQYHSKPCVMASILRVVGVINAFGGIILGFYMEFGLIIDLAVVFSGLMGCLFCFALAKCVDAAHEYLNKY